MLYHPFQMLDLVSGDLTLPVVPMADIRLLVDFEPDSFGHWKFNRGASSLIDVNAGLSLTPPVGSTHSFGASSLILSPAAGKGLLSTMDDQMNQTMVFVVKRPAVHTGSVKFIILGGTLRNNSGDTLGCGVYIRQNNGEADQIGFWARPRSIAQIPIMGWPPGSSPGDYVFIAMSVSGAAAPNSTIIGYVGGVGAATDSRAIAMTISSRKVALGNNVYAEGFAATTPNLDFAEHILFTRAFSATEMAAVYVRSKARMAAIGVTVL